MISFPNAPSLLLSVTPRVHRNHVVTTSGFSSNYNGCYTRAARSTNTLIYRERNSRKGRLDGLDISPDYRDAWRGCAWGPAAYGFRHTPTRTNNKRSQKRRSRMTNWGLQIPACLWRRSWDLTWEFWRVDLETWPWEFRRCLKWLRNNWLLKTY